MVADCSFILFSFINRYNVFPIFSVKMHIVSLLLRLKYNQNLLLGNWETQQTFIPRLSVNSMLLLTYLLPPVWSKWKEKLTLVWFTCVVIKYWQCNVTSIFHNWAPRVSHTYLAWVESSLSGWPVTKIPWNRCSTSISWPVFSFHASSYQKPALT